MRGLSTDQNTTPHIKRRENQRDTQLSVLRDFLAGFALHARMEEVCSLLNRVINLFLIPFRRHVEVLASENTENGSR
jgi:hypothetical protein